MVYFSDCSSPKLACDGAATDPDRPRRERRRRKMMSERQRRQRINTALEEIKAMVGEHAIHDFANMEKADLLSSAVRLLKRLQRQKSDENTPPPSPPRAAQHNYRSGYLECWRAAHSFLTCNSPDSGLAGRLATHMEGFFQRRSEQLFPVHLERPFRCVSNLPPSPTASPSAPASPGEENFWRPFL